MKNSAPINVPKHISDPVQYTIDLGTDSGVIVQIIGHDKDIICIRRDGTAIGYDRIEDQPMSLADIGYADAAGAGDTDFNVSVRSGRDKDVFTCYAIRGNDVFNNWFLTKSGFGQRFRFGSHGDGLKNYGFIWESDNSVRVEYGQNTGFIVWDANAQQWNGNPTDLTNND